MATFAYEIDSLNLDGMTPEDLITTADHLAALEKYARRKAGAMTMRAAGHIGLALKHEATCDEIYQGLPENWRW
jgi:hypothetical protein